MGSMLKSSRDADSCLQTNNRMSDRPAGYAQRDMRESGKNAKSTKNHIRSFAYPVYLAAKKTCTARGGTVTPPARRRVRPPI